MTRDLKLTLILTPVVAVPLFLVLFYLWSPHGGLGSETLALIGFIGVLPFIYVAALTVPLGGAALPLAVLAQLCWTAAWVYAALWTWKFFRHLTSERSD